MMMTNAQTNTYQVLCGYTISKYSNQILDFLPDIEQYDLETYDIYNFSTIFKSLSESISIIACIPAYNEQSTIATMIHKAQT